MIYIVSQINSNWYSINIDDSEDYHEILITNPNSTLISYRVSDLIRQFGSLNLAKIPSVIDLECLDKQFSQVGNDLTSNDKWNILKCLRKYSILTENLKYNIDNIKEFLILIGELYKAIIKTNYEENKRFEEIEIKINKIIYTTQLRGVGVNKSLLKEKCIELEREIYSLKNQLQFEYDIYTPNLISTQIEYIKEKKYTILNSILNTFKSRKIDDKISAIFYELIRNSQDLETLLYISSTWGGEDITHPNFLGFGTITSRIILKEPSLQNLRKKNRDIIIPRKGKKILVIDYSQFEAGILAHLSCDSKLIELYNDDIYLDIVKNILDADPKYISDEEKRKEAKILFYRYMYGDNNLPIKVILYFSKFNKLETFKKALISESNNRKYVDSENGNYRKLDEDNQNNWILSHKIQSIASLIYKKALIEVNDKVKVAKLLIPMHDGSVYEIDENKYFNASIKIKKIYEDKFAEQCPSLNVRADIKESFI